MTKPSIDKKTGLIAVIAASVVALLLFGIRFALIQKEEVHYHANFAVFVNGERLQFDNFSYYEEIEACGGSDVNNPKIRGHMHDQVNHVVHVHDNGVTWGHFFANLGFSLSNDALQTDNDILVDDEGGELNFWLNGKPATTVANSAIGNEDVLLVSYGDTEKNELQQQYDLITKDAAEYNKRDDPSSCSGGKPFSFTERLKTALQFWR